MPKFIRLTMHTGEVHLINADHIMNILPAKNNLTFIGINSLQSGQMVKESVDEILAMVEGDNLKGRVEFLERALNGVIEDGELRVVGDRVFGRTDEGLTFIAASKDKNPELLAYMTEPKAVKS